MSISIFVVQWRGINKLIARCRTLSNPTTGSGAKAKAKKKLNEMGVEVEDE